MYNFMNCLEFSYLIYFKGLFMKNQYIPDKLPMILYFVRNDKAFSRVIDGRG